MIEKFQLKGGICEPSSDISELYGRATSHNTVYAVRTAHANCPSGNFAYTGDIICDVHYDEKEVR